ncbi:hypothetical protein [Streptomyces fumanus]|nr:hypothetical protein [Streptomyces fumanus]
MRLTARGDGDESEVIERGFLAHADREGFALQRVLFEHGPVNVKPVIYGYVRALPELPVHSVQQLKQELSDFAQREGFTLAEVFVEHRWLHSVAWDALVMSCDRHGVRDVVVPDYRHLHSTAALSRVMQAVIEEMMSGRVWFARAHESVPSFHPGSVAE